jgi:DoxX-like family
VLRLRSQPTRTVEVPDGKNVYYRQDLNLKNRTTKESVMRSSKRVFWIVTGAMCLFMALGAVFDVAKSADAVKLIHGLGYPEYFVRFIGVMKLLGVAAVLQQKYPKLKEWAYAGLVFDTGGALFSHISSKSAAADGAPALLGLLLVAGSYALYRRQSIALADDRLSKV